MDRSKVVHLHRLARLAWVVWLGVTLGTGIQVGCDKSPTAPTAPGAPTGPEPLSISGTVVSNPDQRAIPGASIALGNASVTTDAAGRFSFTPPPNPSSSTAVRIAAAGYLTHDSFLLLDRSRANLIIDAISEAPPFSTSFYREFARNAHESPSSLSLLNPWTMAPSFYIKTTLDDTDELIPDAVIDRMRTIFVNSVPELTGGRFSVAAIETGPASRPARLGWVNVLFQKVLPTPTAGGQATVGGNQGTIWLQYPSGGVNPGGPYPTPACQYLSVSAAEHEVVHTMGYWHTSDNFAHFFTASCTGAGRASIVRYHAGIVYSRPPGNADPDSDPSTFVLGFQAQALAARAVISCVLDRN